MKDLKEKSIVLFILDTLEIGGAERSILEISSRFKKYTPIVVTLFKGSHLKNEYLQRGIEVISLDFEKETKEDKLVVEIDKIVSIIKPVIIHATLIRSCLVSRKLSADNKYVLINSLVNNTYGIQRYKTLSPIRALKLLNIQFRDAISSKNVDCFFSNSETIKQTTASALNLDKDKIKVIYRGRDPEAYNERKSESDSNFTFICVGRLIKRKGQLDLIEAFSQHIIEFPNTKLKLVGEGPLRYELEAKISTLNLGEHVELLGQRDDIPKLLANSDCFVFPSYYEGLPGALVEAMLSKIPIIASDIPENLECVNQNTSLIFRHGKINDLVEKMDLARYHQWAEKLEKAYSEAIRNFSIKVIVEEYEATYDNLLKK